MKQGEENIYDKSIFNMKFSDLKKKSSSKKEPVVVQKTKLEFKKSSSEIAESNKKKQEERENLCKPVLRPSLPLQCVLASERDLADIEYWQMLDAMAFDKKTINLMVESIRWYTTFLVRIKNLGTIPVGEIDELLNKSPLFEVKNHRG